MNLSRYEALLFLYIKNYLTAPKGPPHGMLLHVRAADTALMAITNGSAAPSALKSAADT